MYLAQISCFRGLHGSPSKPRNYSTCTVIHGVNDSVYFRAERNWLRAIFLGKN